MKVKVRGVAMGRKMSTDGSHPPSALNYNDNDMKDDLHQLKWDGNEHTVFQFSVNWFQHQKYHNMILGKVVPFAAAFTYTHVQRKKH